MNLKHISCKAIESSTVKYVARFSPEIDVFEINVNNYFLLMYSTSSFVSPKREIILKPFQSAYGKNSQFYLQGSSAREWIQIKVRVLPSPWVLSAANQFYSYHLSQDSRLVLFYTQGVCSYKAETVGWVKLQT